MWQTEPIKTIKLLAFCKTHIWSRNPASKGCNVYSLKFPYTIRAVHLAAMCALTMMTHSTRSHWKTKIYDTLQENVCNECIKRGSKLNLIRVLCGQLSCTLKWSQEVAEFYMNHACWLVTSQPELALGQTKDNTIGQSNAFFYCTAHYFFNPCQLHVYGNTMQRPKRLIQSCFKTPMALSFMGQLFTSMYNISP